MSNDSGPSATDRALLALLALAILWPIILTLKLVDALRGEA